MVFGLGGNNRITAEQRRQEFYGPEGMPYVADAEPGQFPQYVPTPKDQVIDDSKIGIVALTQVKLKHGMYPIQKFTARLLSTLKK